MVQLGAQLVVLNKSKGQPWILGLYLYYDSCLAIPGAKDVVESLFFLRKEKKHTFLLLFPSAKPQAEAAIDGSFTGYYVFDRDQLSE